MWFYLIFIWFSFQACGICCCIQPQLICDCTFRRVVCCGTRTNSWIWRFRRFCSKSNAITNRQKLFRDSLGKRVRRTNGKKRSWRPILCTPLYKNCFRISLLTLVWRKSAKPQEIIALLSLNASRKTVVRKWMKIVQLCTNVYWQISKHLLLSAN